MELFEEVGQTLSRAGQGLAQKARDTAQVTKLKLAVSEDERAIEGIYLSIGKAYCRMCEACSPEQLPSEATSEPIASLLTSLRERKQQLLDKQQTIRVIQQVMICPKCGASCSAEGSFCTNCGASVQLPSLRQQAQARRGLLYAVRQARPVISEKEKDKGD